MSRWKYYLNIELCNLFFIFYPIYYGAFQEMAMPFSGMASTNEVLKSDIANTNQFLLYVAYISVPMGLDKPLSKCSYSLNSF